MSIHWLWPIAFLLSFILTWLVSRFAKRRRLLDIPNERSSHDRPVPRGGGLAIFLVFAVGACILTWYGAIAAPLTAAVVGAGALVTAVGAVDDYRDVAARWRLLSHALAACLALYLLQGMPAGLLPGLPVHVVNALAVLCIVWLINLYNFMDGIDGIAAIEAITVCFGGIVLHASGIAHGAPWVLPALLLACVSGFLYWNYPPARIFLGDVGSGFLGFMMAMFCVQAAQFGAELFWAWVVLLGAFIVDSGVTLFRRLLRRQRLYEAHRSHAYQFASRRHGGHAPVSLTIGAINLFWLLPLALVTAARAAPPLLMLVVAYAPLIGLAFHYRAGAPERQEA